MYELPNDLYILLGVINTKLRDYYGSLDELIDDLEIDKDILIKKLESIGYKYDKKLNAFKIKLDEKYI